MAQQTVEASEVREGDFFPALDNGYVVEVETEDDLWGSPSVVITFHDRHGDEAQLRCAPDMLVTVERGEA